MGKLSRMAVGGRPPLALGWLPALALARMNAKDRRAFQKSDGWPDTLGSTAVLSPHRIGNREMSSYCAKGSDNRSGAAQNHLGCKRAGADGSLRTAYGKELVANSFWEKTPISMTTSARMKDRAARTGSARLMFEFAVAVVACLVGAALGVRFSVLALVPALVVLLILAGSREARRSGGRGLRYFQPRSLRFSSTVRRSGP
jgi:hypothetical protein